MDELGSIAWDDRYIPSPRTRSPVQYLNKEFLFWEGIENYGNEVRTLPPITKPRKTPAPIPSGAVVIKLED